MSSPGPPPAHRTAEDRLAVAAALTDALLPAGPADPVERVVHATLEVLAEQGTAAVDFDEVGVRAGVAAATLALQFDDADDLVRFAFEEAGAGICEVVASAERADDAVHLILPALSMNAPYAQAFARVVLDGYGIDGVQRRFPLAEHLVALFTEQQGGVGPIDPRVAAAAVVTLALSWHFNGDFLKRAYGLDALDEVEVRRQLSTMLEAIVGLASGPRLD